jgi:hypothetical protein
VRREPVVGRREPVRQPVREREPTFWDRMTGRDRERDVVRDREAVADREREGEALVPPAQRVGPERDGETLRDESDTRR